MQIKHGNLLAAALLCGGLLFLGGCQPQGPVAKPVSVAPDPSAPKDTPPPKPAAQLRDVFPADGFQDWDGQQPKGWTVPQAALVKKAAKGQSGTGVELLPDPKKYAAIRRKLPGDLAGKTVQLALRGKAAEEKKLVCALRYQVGEDEGFHTVEHSGGGEWETLRMTRSLPKDLKKGSAELRISLRPGAAKPAFVDDVTCQVKVK